MFDQTTTAQYIDTMVAQVAGRCPITLNRLTLGSHPDGARREEGELALIDWERPGGEVVDCYGPEGEFVRRSGPLRALGAAMLAADKYHQACADMRIAELVIEAERIAREVPGGPEDPALRMALAARSAAAAMLGRPGACRTCTDCRGNERSLPDNAARPQAVLPIHPWDFDLLRAVASCPIGPVAAVAA